MRFLVVAMVCVLSLGAGTAWSDSRAGFMSFREAKQFLKEEVYRPGMRDFYCGCEIGAIGKKWVVGLEGCGYQVRTNVERASRIEWEHVVSAADFGRQRPCWRAGGRKFCEESDPGFGQMHGDPHNLLPVVGEVNADRGSLRFGMIGPGAGQGYGQCSSRVDFKAGIFMPREEARGDVARINFYFRDRYGMRLSPGQEKLFSAWSAADPVDRIECWKNVAVWRKTGVQNPHVTAGCSSGR